MGSRRQVYATIEDTDSNTEWHKQSQYIGLTETVVGCSLAPHTSFLMPFTGCTGPVVHFHGLIGLKNGTHVLGVPGLY